MNSRRLPFVLLLLLLPVPAQADRHFMECFGGLSPEKKQAVSARASCGVRVESVPAILAPPPPPPPPPALGQQVPPLNGLGHGTARKSATWDPDATPAKNEGWSGLKKHSLFVVGEVSEYITGTDSGKRLDGWMVGGRAMFRGQSTTEPFVHLLIGRQRPARPNTVSAASDPATDDDWTVALGFGFDFEMYPVIQGNEPFVVPVWRLQLDALKPWGADVSNAYGRLTFGISLRFEGLHK